MKKVLSLLLSFVFLDVQSWALSGGPVYGNFDQALSVVGTYSGVLVIDSETHPSGNFSSAAIGLFSLGVPESGPSTGAAIVFVEGTAFNGNITGVVDPGDGSFDAIVDAVSTYSVQQLVQTGVDANGNPTFTVVDTNIFAQGNIAAQISIADGAVNPAVGVLPGSTRVEGTASIDVFGQVNPDGTPDVTNTATFTVDGFKQSDTATTATFTFGSNFNNNNTP